MTAEESKIMLEMEKRLSEGKDIPTSPEKEELYTIVGDLIEKEIIMYDEFVEDVLKVLTYSVNVSTPMTLEDRQEEMKGIYTTLINKYKQLNTKEDDKDIDG